METLSNMFVSMQIYEFLSKSQQLLFGGVGFILYFSNSETDNRT